MLGGWRRGRTSLLCLLLVLSGCGRCGGTPIEVSKVVVDLPPNLGRVEGLRSALREGAWQCVKGQKRLRRVDTGGAALRVEVGALWVDGEASGWPLQISLMGTEVPLHSDILVPRVGEVSAKDVLVENLATHCRDLEDLLALESVSEDELIALLGKPEAPLFASAIDVAASREGERYTDALVTVLNDEAIASELRLRVLGSFAEGRERSVVPHLIALTRQRHPALVAQIFYALGQIGGPEAEGFLVTAESGHPEPMLQQVAREALQEIRTRSEERP